MADRYELDKALIERLSEDVLCTRYKDGTSVDEKDALEIDQTYHFMAQGKDIFILVDMKGVTNKLTSKASEFFTRKAKMIPYTKAVGLVMDNFTSKFTSKVHQQLYKPLYPTKIFKSTEEALAWFEKLRNEG